MKTQISRDSFDLAKRYSGLYLQQGRMIVDADVNELTDISKTRLESALANAIGSGAPRVGALALAKSGANFVVQPGGIYAEGVPARLDGTTTIPLGAQPDYANPPVLPVNNFRVYVDVWERAVSALEDSALQDAGLHGADTATRSKNMLQVKWCANGIDPLNPAVNPQIGNALLTLKLRLISTAADPCDPCAAEVAVDERIGNYLFRVEVHDVFIAGGQQHVVLKWSRDNGAEAYPFDTYPADFDQGDWVWEFFDTASENLLGHHFPAGEARRRGVIRDTFTRPVAPLPNAFVRQWDGYVEFNLTTGALVAGSDRGVPLSTGLANTAHAYVNFSGTTAKVNLELLELTLNYGTKQFVAGDYWQAAVREAVDVSGAIVLGGASGETPRGVRHHYAALGQVDVAGNLVPVTDAFRRQMSFPPLTDLRAGDVGFTNNCSAIYGGAENVQQALDAICGIGAEDIGYTVPGCGTAAAPSVATLLSAIAGFPDRDGVPKSPSVKDILDYLMCDLNAARLPYDGTAQAARWSDINEGTAAPLTVQQALDNLVANLDAGDISANLPACVDAAGSKTLRELLGVPGGAQTILELLRKLYCDVRATHIPLDRSKLVCADLATDASVVSVQDAIEKLCANEGNGCEVTVPVGELDKRLRDFAASAVLDLSLCLLPGAHVMADNIVIAGKRSLRIKSAAAAATSIAFKGSQQIFGVNEIVFENVTFILPTASQMQLNGARVSSERCIYSRSGPSHHAIPSVRIGTRTQAAQLLWADNVMSDTWLQARPGFTDFTTVAAVGNQRVADAFKRVTDDPTLFTDPPRFQGALDEITDSVAAMPAVDRKRWAAVIEARTPVVNPVLAPPGNVVVRNAAQLGVKKVPAKSAKAARTSAKPAKAKAAATGTVAETGNVNALAAPAAGLTRVFVSDPVVTAGIVTPGTGLPIFIDQSVSTNTRGAVDFTTALAAASPTRDAIRDAVLGGVIDVIFDSGVNPALGLSSHRCNGSIEGNLVNGEVILMNEFETSGAGAGVDAGTSILKILSTLTELVAAAGGTLTIEDNRIDRLWSLTAAPDANGQLNAAINGMAACTLHGNQLIGINHALVARKLAVSDNHFESTITNEDDGSALYGRMLVNRATVVGNLSLEAAEAILTFALSSAAFRANSNFFLVRKF